MPRKARKKSRTGIYHVMLRGINRQTIFEDKEDKLRFLATLKKYKELCKFVIYGYCLMDNHVHLLIKESEEESFSETIKRISSSYVHWYNRKYGRCGHLFQERFKSENVDDRHYFLIVLRYIHQNPIKAGLAKNVFECKWTSFHEYIGKPKIVDIEVALRLFSPDRNKAIVRFIEYMNKANEDQCLDDVEKVRMSDNEVREYLSQLGMTNSSELQRMDREQRDALLAKLKKLDGVTVRQLSRITGISRSVIQRVR